MTTPFDAGINGFTGRERLKIIQDGNQLDVSIAQLAAAMALPGGGLPAANATMGVLATASYLGFVASGTATPNTLITDKSGRSTDYVVLLDNVATIQLEYANFYCKATAPMEASPGAPTTYQAWVKVGASWTRVTWGGYNTVVAPDGGTTGLSDPITVNGKKGDIIVYQTEAENANGLCVFSDSKYCYAGTNPNVALINRQTQTSATPGQFANTPPETAITPTSASLVLKATAIVGITTRPSVAIYGNSRDWGLGEDKSDMNVSITIDGTPSRGQIGRALGKQIAVSNYAVASDTQRNFVTGTNGSKRAYFAKYASHVSGYDMINDVTANRTTAEMLADFVTFRAMFPGKFLIMPTTSPSTTSTGDWITGTQTPITQDQARQDWNGLLRSNQVPSVQVVYDIDAINARNLNASSGKPYDGAWGTWNDKARTGDGLHQCFNGYVAIDQSGEVRAEKLRF